MNLYFFYVRQPALPKPGSLRARRVHRTTGAASLQPRVGLRGWLWLPLLSVCLTCRWLCGLLTTKSSRFEVVVLGDIPNRVMFNEGYFLDDTGYVVSVYGVRLGDQPGSRGPDWAVGLGRNFAGRLEVVSTRIGISSAWLLHPCYLRPERCTTLLPSRPHPSAVDDHRHGHHRVCPNRPDRHLRFNAVSPDWRGERR